MPRLSGMTQLYYLCGLFASISGQSFDNADFLQLGKAGRDPPPKVLPYYSGESGERTAGHKTLVHQMDVDGNEQLDDAELDWFGFNFPSIKQSLDADADGVITALELRRAVSDLKGVEPGPTVAMAMLKAKKDEVVMQKEKKAEFNFQAAKTNQAMLDQLFSAKEQMSSKDLRKLGFDSNAIRRTLDRNGDGKVTRAEFGEAIANAGKFMKVKELEGTVARVDKKGQHAKGMNTMQQRTDKKKEGACHEKDWCHMKKDNCHILGNWKEEKALRKNCPCTCPE